MTVGQRLVHLALHVLILLTFALGTASAAGGPAGAAGDAGRWLATAGATFLVAAVLHAFLARSFPVRGWLRGPVRVVLGGLTFGAVAIVLGVWSWPDAPTRVLGLGVLYGLFTSFVPVPIGATNRKEPAR